MFGTERIGGITEQAARLADDSHRMVLNHASSLGDRNVRFARKQLESAAGELREQSRSNREFARRMSDHAEKQRGAFQTLAGEALDSYVELVFAPFSYYRRGLKQVEDNVKNFPGVWSVDSGFPIRGYDELSVAEISRRLDGLSAEQVQQVREYEKKNKNRESLIEQLDRKIKNAS